MTTKQFSILISVFFINLLAAYSVSYITLKGGMPVSSESICRTNDSGQSYCRYKGRVQQLYVNQEGQILVYLDDAFDLEQAKEKGYVIGNGTVVSMLATGTPASEEMQSSLRMAFENKYEVELHMRDVHKGTLLLDRMWIK